MIIDANGKCAFEIRDSTGKEFKKIYDADGNLLFKNWNTIQGTPPIVFKGYNKTLKNYKIYGNTIQDGTPTPETPVEVQGCGERTKNLLDNIGTTTTRNGVTFTVDNASGTITANGKATQNAFFTIKIPSNVTGNFYYSGCPVGGGMTTYDIYPWDNTLNKRPTDWDGNPTSQADNDFGEGMSKIKIVDGHTTSIGCRIYSGYNAQNIVFRPMLRIPSESNEFEPIGYKIPVTVGGVNLFDYNWLWTKENTKLNDYFNYITIAMKPNTEYTISNNYRVKVNPGNSLETAMIVVNSETKITTANGGVDRVKTVTTASDGLLRIAYRLFLSGQSYQDIVVNRDTLADGTYYIQINEGSSALPYEPYHEPITTPVYVGSEPLHKIDGYADYIDYKRGVVVRNIKKIALTGDENWSNEVKNENQNVYKIENFANFRSFSNIGICRCTHILYMYPPYPSDLFDRIVLLNVSIYPYTLYFSTKKIMGFNTLESFKTFLAAQYEAGTPVTVWYVLAKPKETPLTDLDPITPLKGVNTLSTNTTVQPSEIYLKGKIKSLATHMLVDSNGNILLTSNNYQLVTKEE